MPQANRDGYSLVEFAYARLRAGIASGQFQAGTRMRELELATWLKISRTPVREALNLLESEGIIVSAPRRGRVVASVSQKEISEIFAVRDALECLSARLAAKHASTAEIAAMREQLRLQSTLSPQEIEALDAANAVFHDIVYRAAGNRYLILALNSLKNSLILLPGTIYMASGRAETALEEHEALVDAIEQRNPDRAHEVASLHIRTAEKIRLMLLVDATSAAAH